LNEIVDAVKEDIRKLGARNNGPMNGWTVTDQLQRHFFMEEVNTLKKAKQSLKSRFDVADSTPRRKLTPRIPERTGNVHREPTGNTTSEPVVSRYQTRRK